MNRQNLSPTTITIKDTINVPVDNGEKVKDSERCVCLEWVNVGGVGGENESVILNAGYFS